jgi:hypothetical protein
MKVIFFFNKIYDKIEEDREHNGEMFDKDFLEYMKKESNEGKRLEKNQMKQRKPELGKIVLQNDYVPKVELSKRHVSLNLLRTNSNCSANLSGSKKHRYQYDEESIASEQAQKLGALNVMMM